MKKVLIVWLHYESIVRNKYVLGFIVVISLVLYFVLKFFPKMADQASHSQCTLSLLSYFLEPSTPAGLV
jgi:hypothetical protein